MTTDVSISGDAIVNLSASAAEHIRGMATTQPENADKFLRIYVEGGGCSGMQYGMVFDEKRDDDLVAMLHGVTVLVDPVSSDYLRGAVVDYVDALNGGGFKITNPYAKSNCGCGKSFVA